MNAIRIVTRPFARTLAVSAALALLAVPVAWAQQSGGARAPAGNGGAQGTVGGGATGAANRGGAGGVANPSPGGARPNAGEPGNSEGPAGAVNQRSGYLGGRDTGSSDEDGGGGSTPATTTTIGTPTAAGVGSEPNCHDFNPAGVSPTERLSGENMARIEDVRALIAARTIAKGQRRPSRYLLANFQEELAKPAPDLAAAGEYLGIAAQEPVTPKLVMRVSQLLCVPMTEGEAAQISRTAESQRLRLHGK